MPEGGERFGSPDVVLVERVSSIDDDVALAEERDDLVEGGVDEGSGDHDPDRARLLQFCHEVLERVSGDGTVLRQILRRFRVQVEDDTLMAAAQKAPHHVRAHSSQSDHSEFHHSLLGRARRLRESYVRIQGGSQTRGKEGRALAVTGSR
jgi:hypothetical protein